MTIQEYLAELYAKLQELSDIILTSSIQREIDANLGIGFTKGRIVFLDGSTLDFSEQLPVERAKFRLHYMDAENNLILRWDSARRMVWQHVISVGKSCMRVLQALNSTKTGSR